MSLPRHRALDYVRRRITRWKDSLEALPVIACIMEFGVTEGRGTVRKCLLAELFVEIESIPGFLSKETFDDVDRPRRRVTTSYWSDAGALSSWMRNPAHIHAIGLGKHEIFSHYNIKIASIERETNWTAPTRSGGVAIQAGKAGQLVWIASALRASR